MFPKNYVPTLAMRPSEMKGLEFLSGKIKDRMTPCILLAPWVGTSSLKRAIERAEKAFPNRNYFLDIDRDYQYTNLDDPAQKELNYLSDPANWTEWIEFIKDSDHIFPCIQVKGKSEIEIRQQIEATQKLGRQYCMRIEINRFPDNFDKIVSAFTVAGSADFTVILEGGWTENVLSLSVWFDGLITGGLQRIDASIPVVVSCASIPKEFSRFSGISPVQFHNRQLVQQLQQKSNRSSIIYGDWGSTRPREGNDFARLPKDRIDYPLDDTWYIVRNLNEGWDFKRAAQELIHNKEIWDDDLDTLGVEMIRRTATIGKEIGIDSSQKNTTSRVNIHLHRQALYGQDDTHGMSFDDDWED
ncbi:MAG: hypothetical protein OXF24_05810 [Hyphomicrobiales bacterium]|nr:hypothetical protein [Hyphomicrobiales bacterium]MCY4049083.1 hypothetical protein [Hyphomicrobiales bacterium]MCY4053256.1 hypothetical protein [Hyphomicrobiales bacterium]